MSAAEEHEMVEKKLDEVCSLLESIEGIEWVISVRKPSGCVKIESNDWLLSVGLAELVKKHAIEYYKL